MRTVRAVRTGLTDAVEVSVEEAALVVASIAHALHGAIGITEEYNLQLFTRRLHEWRVAHGSEDYWNPVIGRAALCSDSSIVDFVRTA